MLLSLSALINFRKIDFNNGKWFTFNNFVCLIVLASIYLVPLILAILSYYNFDDFKDEDSYNSNKWGFHLKPIRMEKVLKNEPSVVKHALNHHKLSKGMAVAAGFVPYFRYLVFCHILVFLHDYQWA